MGQFAQDTVSGEHKYRVGKNYKLHEDKYNFSGLSHTTLILDINIFEKHNCNIRGL